MESFWKKDNIVSQFEKFLKVYYQEMMLPFFMQTFMCLLYVYIFYEWKNRHRNPSRKNFICINLLIIYLSIYPSFYISKQWFKLYLCIFFCKDGFAIK